MRPTDEDQSGSRRPNLMSSTRRSANEVNILAMLDRHAAGGLPKRLLRRLRGTPALFRYGAAGVLALGLLGALAWLARDSGAPSAVDTALAGAVTSGSRPAGAAASSPAGATPGLGSDTVADAAPVAAARGGATIVDLTPPPEPLPQAPEAATALPAPQQHAWRIAQHDALRAPRLARTAPRPVPSKAAAATPRVPASAHAEPRARRLAAPPKAAPAPVDTDVALISAIIEHASRRQEAEEAIRKP